MMKKQISTDAKIGLFVLITLGILAYITIDVSNLALSPGRTKTIYAFLDNAEGITKKTPVQIAGIPVGVVNSVELIDGRRAKIGLKIKKDVPVTEDMEVLVMTRGVLGDTYLEILPGPVGDLPIHSGGMLANAHRLTNYQDLFANASQITEDLKEITTALRKYTASDHSTVANILGNMEVLTENMANFSVKNAEHMNTLVANLAAISQDLRRLSSEGGTDLEETLARINAITEKIDKGEGTVGKLLNDEETVDKANRILNNLEDITTTFFSLKTELGYHLEYLGNAGTAKNYFDFKLKPAPDKYFHFGVVYNPNPPGSSGFQTEIFTTNGVETVVDKETIKYPKVLFTAELAKKFGDWTLRGGLIESKGGLGVNYDRGPVGVSMEAYNFGDGNVHLKALTNLNITRSIYLLGGVDDITSRDSGIDYFLGAGLRFTDDDINSLFGGASLLAQ